MKINNQIWLGAAPIFLLAGLLPLPAAGQRADHLVISQIQITGGSGKTHHDFIEIHNPASAPVDLQGYRLVKRTKEGTADTLIKSFTASTIVPAAGYFLWVNSDYAEIEVAPDVTTFQTLAADNAVALRNGPNDTGDIIDAVGWGEAVNSLVEGSAFLESPGEGQALWRIEDSTDSNNNASDFKLNTPRPRNSESMALPPPNQDQEQSQPNKEQEENNQEAENPAPAPVSAAPAVDYASLAKNIVISEIVPNPEGTDQGNEWVEFYNSGAQTIGLSGWIIDDSRDVLAKNAHKISAGSEISASGYIVITLPKGAPALNNSGGDCVKLYSPDEVFRKKVCYQESFSEGQSYALRPDSLYAATEEITKGSANSFSASESASNIAEINANIVINEAYPNPEGEQDEEFIELRNLGSDEIDLAGWEIADRSRKYKIVRDDFSETEIGPHGFFVLPRTITRIALNNTGGEKVTLYDTSGKEHASVEYEGSAPKGLSFSRNEDGDYEWSLIVTAGEENVIEGNEFLESPGQQEEDGFFDGDDKVEIYRLAELRNLPQGSRVETEGLVSAVPGTFGDRVIYLAGSGIRVSFASGAIVPKLAIGDRVLLTGILTSSRNELQLIVNEADSVTVENSGEPPEPHTIKTGEVGEETEGFLVRIAGKITRSSGSTFYIDDGSGEARILVMDSTGIKKPETKKGNSAVITGIVTQFGDVYRITPRIQSDIEVGGVLGAGLPITGVGFLETTLVAILLFILSLKLLKIEKFR